MSPDTRDDAGAPAAPAARAPESSPAGRALWLAAMLAATCGLWAVLSVVPFLPTNDGPQHLMMGHIENHYEDTDTIYRHFLAPASQFAGRGFTAIFVPLDSILPWRTAFRVALMIIVGAWSWAFAALVLALDPRRRWVALLGFAAAFQWTVYMGFFAFALGSACGMLLIALTVATPRWSVPRLSILAAGLLLQGYFHVVSALLTALIVGFVTLWRGATWRERLRGAASVAAAGVPMALLFLMTLREQPGMTKIPHADATVFVPLADKLRYVHRCFQPGADFRGIVFGALALAGMWRGLGRLRGGGRRVEGGLTIAALLFLGMGVFGPERLPGWQFFYQRFLPFGVMLSLLQLDVERLPRIGRAVVALVVAGFTVASLLAVSSLDRKLYARSADVFSGLEQPIKRHGPRLPITRDPWASLPPRYNPVPNMVPLHAVGALFVVEQGGMIPYNFIGFPSMHQFVARDDNWDADFPTAPAADKLQEVAHLSPRSAERLAVLEGLALTGTAYEDIVMVSDPVDAEVFRRRGYADDYQRGELYMAHYRGCEVEVVLPSVAGVDAIEYGWWPATDASRRQPLGGVQPGADGKLHVPLPGAPCGSLWVRVASSAGACRGADEGGRIVTRVEQGRHNVVACDL